MKGYRPETRGPPRGRKGSVMEAIIVLFVIILGLIGLDVAAVIRGADSRDPLPDTHTR